MSDIKELITDNAFAEEFFNYTGLFYRTFDISLTVMSLLESLFFNDPRGIAIATFIVLSTMTNLSLKELFSSAMQKGDHTILGSGERPTNSKDCSYTCDKKTDKSYGMPSGHSQNFSMIATLIGLGIWDKNKDDTWLYWRLGFIILAVFGAMYARVHLGCHTWQQTIVGSLVGISLAYILDKYVTNPFAHDKSYYL